MPLTEEEKAKIEEEEKYRLKAKEKAEKKPLLKQKIGCGGLILIIIIILVAYAIISGLTKTPQEKATGNARDVYEQLVMDNAITVIEEIPTYASNQTKICAYKSGYLVEDIYNAEWYVVGKTIYAVNGLAKTLTPNVDYAPAEISYQPCY